MISWSKNYLINGDMAIAQRGTSFTVNYSTLTNAFPSDRFSYGLIGVPTVNPAHTVSRASLSTSDMPYKLGLRYTSRVEATTIGTFGTTSTGAYLRYPVEGSDFASIAQKTVNISFWFKSSRAISFNIFLQNTGNNRGYLKTLTVASANVWQEFSFSVDFKTGTSAGSWTYDTTNRGVAIGIAPILTGATWDGSEGWQSAQVFLTSSVRSNNLFQANGDYFEITGIRLTEGAEKQPYRKAGGSYAGELALCQRYCVVYGGSGSISAIGAHGVANDTSEWTASMSLPVTMRATPTLVTQGVASDYVLRTAAGVNTTLTSLPTIFRSNNKMILLDTVITSALVAGRSYFLADNSTTAAKLILDAEI